MQKHNFWDKQPIDISKNSVESHKIRTYNDDEIEKTPINLPKAYSWSNIDLTNEKELSELQIFLRTYYSFDIDPDIIKNYSSEFLKWFLMPPNYFPDLILGIRCNNVLIATICGIPMKMHIYDKLIDIIEINFLCINPKLRNKKFAPVLIQEIIRRVKIHSVWAAIYTGGLDLPHCIVKCRYYSRPINIPKLVNLDLMEQPKNISKYKILSKPSINIRKLKEEDCEICCEKFNTFHKKFKIGMYFTLEYFKQHFLGIHSYVVEIDNKITDFISFYKVPIVMLKNDNKEINRYNIYYYFYFETELDILVDNALYFIKKDGGELVRCLNQYDNKKFIEKLNFLEDSINLNFFLYNWACPPIDTSDMSLLMI